MRRKGEVEILSRSEGDNYTIGEHGNLITRIRIKLNVLAKSGKLWSAPSQRQRHRALRSRLRPTTKVPSLQATHDLPRLNLCLYSTVSSSFDGNKEHGVATSSGISGHHLLTSEPTEPKPPRITEPSIEQMLDVDSPSADHGGFRLCHSQSSKCSHQAPAIPSPPIPSTVIIPSGVQPWEYETVKAFLERRAQNQRLESTATQGLEGQGECAKSLGWELTAYRCERA